MYYSDKPVEFEIEDTLDRGKFSKNFAKTLNDFKCNETFTIGLFGEWGSGKTSIVNMALEELDRLQESEENKIITLKFEPWHFTDSTQLFNQFLISLANEFMTKKDKGLHKVGKALCKYSSTFELAELIPIPVLGKVVANLGKNSLDKIGKHLQGDLESKDILKQKEIVVKLLREVNQKILIVIDDIDRLSNEQIRQVFQLISAVAKFPNTIYLLVFDKNIVVKALGKIQQGDGEDYLKKIIQIPIQIPKIKPYKLFNVMFNNLNKIVEENYNVKFEQEHWNCIFKFCVEPFIKNLRDVSRLSNALQFKVINIAEEIDFSDLIGISVLEIMEPQIHEWIINNKSRLVRTSNIGSTNSSEQDARFKLIYNEIKDILGYNGTENSIIIEKRIENALTAISCLFPTFGNTIGKNYISISLNDSRKYNFICHEDKFDRYFDLDIDEVIVKQSIVDKVINEYSGDEIKNLLVELENKNKSYEMLEEIDSTLLDVQSQRLTIILEGILNACYSFKSKQAKSITWISSQSKAEHLIYKIIKNIDKLIRGEYLISLIKKADAFSLETIANIINMIELGFGRLAANGIERTEYEKLVSIEELEQMEKEYATQCKIIFAQTSIFDLHSWRMAYYLWKNFDSGYVSIYLSEQFKEDNKVIIYLDELVGEWSGSSISYEIAKKEDEFISRDRILEAINNSIASKRLFDLPIRAQRKAAAYYLSENKEVGFRGEVSQKATDCWLNQQKSN